MTFLKIFQQIIYVFLLFLTVPRCLSVLAIYKLMRRQSESSIVTSSIRTLPSLSSTLCLTLIFKLPQIVINTTHELVLSCEQYILSLKSSINSFSVSIEKYVSCKKSIPVGHIGCSTLVGQRPMKSLSFVCLSVRLSVCLSVRLSVHSSVCQ